MKNKNLLKRISAILFCCSIVFSCLMVPAFAANRSNSNMTTSCTEAEASMRVFTGGYRTEKITCEMTGTSSIFDVLSGSTYLLDINETESENNALSCQLNYLAEDSLLTIEKIICISFKGYIEQSLVGNWTLNA